MSFSRTVGDTLYVSIRGRFAPYFWAVMVGCSGEGCSYRVP